MRFSPVRAALEPPSNDTDVLTIGMYGPLSSPWAVTHLVAAILADHDFRKTYDPAIRNRFKTMLANGSYAPMAPGINIPNLNPRLRIRLIIGDDAEKVNIGVRTALGYVYGPDGKPAVNAVFGGWQSEIAKPVASLCSTMEVVYLAYGAQSVDLSNKDVYPYFFRLLSADSTVGRVFWGYMKAFGWRSGVMLHTDEAFGQGIFASISGSSQAEGRAGSVVGVGLKPMSVNFDPEVARAAVQRVKLANSRLVMVVIGGTLEVNTRAVMREENVTSPNYQILITHMAVSSVTRAEDYLRFEGCQSIYGYVAYNPPLRNVLAMWPQMRPSDVLDNMAYYGIDKWVTPLSNSSLTAQLFAAFSISTAAASGLVYNGYWALVRAFNEMLNDGYKPSEIRGAALRRYLKNVTFEAFAYPVMFDANQDGVLSYIVQYLNPVSPGFPVSWTGFGVYSDITRIMTPSNTGTGPKWATGENSLRAPQVLAGCPPGTFLDMSLNAGAGGCATCPEGRISEVYDETECRRCPAGTKEVRRTVCEVCRAGSSSPEGSSVCSPCEAGAASDKDGQSRCSQCNLGKYQGSSGQQSCLSCAPGFIADSPGMVECTPCPRGQVQPSTGGTECVRCPKGSYMMQPGAAFCDMCAPGTVTEGVGAQNPDECVCKEGLYQLADNSGCAPCPLGMECKVGSKAANLLAIHDGVGNLGEYPTLLPGFWTSWDKPFSVFACKSALHCPGGLPESCLANLVQQSCAVCDNEMWWEGNTCKRCPKLETTGVIFPALPVVLVPIGLVILYSRTGKGLETWGSWSNGIASLLFVLLNHYQIIDLIKVTGPKAPDDMAAIYNSFGFSLDLLGVFKLPCAGFGGFEAGLVIRICAPAILCGLTIVTYFGSHLFSILTRRKYLKMDMNRLSNVFMSLIFTFFTAIAALSLALFKCSPNPNGLRTLTADRSINCYESGRWMRMLALAIVAVVVYCIGVGSVLFRTVLVAPQRFHQPGFSVRWKFLFIRFRPDVYWWSLTFLAKNLLLNLGVVVYDYALSAIYHEMGVIMVYLILLAVFMPYRHRMINYIEIVVCVALNFCMAMLSTFVDESDGQSQLGRASAFVVFIPVALSPLVALNIVWPKLFTKRYEETQDAAEKRIIACVETISVLHGDDLRAFVKGLSEWDRWYMNMLCDIVQTELLGEEGQNKRWRNTTKDYTESVDSGKQLRSTNKGEGTPQSSKSVREFRKEKLAEGALPEEPVFGIQSSVVRV